MVNCPKETIKLVLKIKNFVCPSQGRWRKALAQGNKIKVDKSHSVIDLLLIHLGIGFNSFLRIKIYTILICDLVARNSVTPYNSALYFNKYKAGIMLLILKCYFGISKLSSIDNVLFLVLALRSLWLLVCVHASFIHI